MSVSLGCLRILKEIAVHAKSTFHDCIRSYALARNGRSAVAQDNGRQQPSARQPLQHIHTPESIDQKLAQLTKDLELTPEQQQQVRPLLEEHHDRIQALLDKNPKASRQELARKFTPSATKRTTRFMLCLRITRKNWKRRCGNAGIMAEKTGDQLRLRQHRQSHLPRPLDISGIRPNRKAHKGGKSGLGQGIRTSCVNLVANHRRNHRLQDLASHRLQHLRAHLSQYVRHQCVHVLLRRFRNLQRDIGSLLDDGLRDAPSA